VFLQWWIVIKVKATIRDAAFCFANALAHRWPAWQRSAADRRNTSADQLSHEQRAECF